MAASSRRTEEKVASRRGSGRHWRRASRALLLSLRLEGESAHPDQRRHALRAYITGRKVQLEASLPKEAADNVLEQPHSLLLNELRNHVAQDRAHGIESLISGADICETNVVEKDLLHYKDRHRLAQLGAGLHDAEAERDDFGSEKEIDHIGRIILDKRANHAQRSETQIFERAGLGRRVEERIEKKRNMSFFHSRVSLPITKREYVQTAYR